MQPPLHPRTGDRVRVAIVGGGFAAAEALIALRRLAGDRVAIDLIAAHPELRLRPLAVAAPFGSEDVGGVPLADLCADHEATLHHGTVTRVDVPGHRLETDSRETVSFDAAVVATGGRPRAAIDGALLFDGRRGIVELRRLITQMGEGRSGTIAFAVPAGVTWSLPAYELALMTALRAEGRTPVVVVTPESAPLELFGPAASRRTAALLAERGVEVICDSEPLRVVPAGLQTTGGVVAAHHVVALPRIEGPRIPGVPTDRDGFIPVDEHLRVEGTANLYAAGDAIAFPVKQGGLAAQQADAAAEAIAARAGAPVEPRPFRPILRAMLLTGAIPLFVRGQEPGPADSEAALWRPVGKVSAIHLSPWLCDRAEARPGSAAPLAGRDAPANAPTEADQAALELALGLADDEAQAGEVAGALAWLEAVDAVHGVLPPEYAEKRRRWELPGAVPTAGHTS